MTKPTLLLVEDDRALADLLMWHFEREGYEIVRTADGDEALILAEERTPDLVILDWMIEGVSGIEVCRRLRRRASTAHVPIIMLTARGEESDRIRGLDTGADDYVVKPFEYPELAARVKALLRRSLKAAGDVLALGPLGIDFSAQSVRLDGEALELTAYEYRLLEYLVRERARVVTRQELSDYLYPHGEDRDSNVLEVLIGRLRRKLDPQGTLAPIETVRGRGYRFTLG